MVPKTFGDVNFQELKLILMCIYSQTCKLHAAFLEKFGEQSVVCKSTYLCNMMKYFLCF